MKKMIGIAAGCLLVFSAAGQQAPPKTGEPDPAKKTLIVETACGECRLGLHGKSCDLAVRIDGKAYFVDGAGIDSFGDPHAREGFCRVIRKAEVQGTIVGNRFKASYFRLLPSSQKNTGKPAAADNRAAVADLYAAKPSCLKCLFL